VVLASNLFAMLLQHLSLKLGIVTGRDLAQPAATIIRVRWLSSFGCSAKSPSPPATWPK
jgi:Mn2+/Fe2+ NRAMP family transporter